MRRAPGLPGALFYTGADDLDIFPRMVYHTDEGGEDPPDLPAGRNKKSEEKK